MAAPTNVRVESNSISTAVIRWSDNGAALIGVWRSTDGASYSEVTTTRVAIGTQTYTDTGLSAGTKYWYKLSDDLGISFSSVVTVVTHLCDPGTTEGAFALPRFGDAEEDRESDKLNSMAERIESVLEDRVLEPGECATCPSDGAIVLDCKTGCKDWVVVADEDINSITIDGCQDPNIKFIVDPSATRKICGWPGGFGFTGDECFEAPISGGSIGRTVEIGRNPPSSRRGYPGPAGGGSGGSGCTCVPTGENELTVKCCNSGGDGCNLDCGSSKSLKLVICGGKPPYTVAVSGNLVLSSTSVTKEGGSVTVTPPTNTGSGEPGTAFEVYIKFTDVAGLNAWFAQTYGCNDTVVAGAHNNNCGFLGTRTCNNGNITSCTQIPCSTACEAFECGSPSQPCAGPCRFNCAGDLRPGKLCDKRTGAMITAGCKPCSIESGDQTVTVTDDVGVSVVTVLKA